MPARRKPLRRRCSYTERGRGCPFDGTGTPPLCDAHRIALAEAGRPKAPVEVIASAVQNFLNGKPINVEQTIGAVTASLGGAWAGFADAYRPPIAGNEDQTHRRAGRHDAPPPGWGHAAQPPDPEVLARRRARQVMGFAPSDVLSEEVIKETRRKLAKKHHPDRGGSTARMAEIMDAADVLLAEVQAA